MLPLPVEFSYPTLRSLHDYFSRLPPERFDSEFRACADYVQQAKRRHKWLAYSSVFNENDET